MPDDTGDRSGRHISSSTRHWILGSALLAVLGFLLGVMFGGRNALPGPGGTGSSQVSEQRSAGTETMPRGAPAVAPSLADPDTVDPGSAVLQGITQADAEARQSWRALEAEFAREPRVARWAAAMEAAMQETMLGPAMGRVGRPSSLDVDCRSRRCRTSATFATRTLAEDWLQIFQVASGQDLPRSMSNLIPGPEGTWEVRVYGGVP